MKQTVGFIALFLVLELVFFIKKLYQSMALTLLVFLIFSLVFFLHNIPDFAKKTAKFIKMHTQPPHKRIKKIVVGHQKTSDYTILRVEKEAKEVFNNESDREHHRTDNNIETPTSCVIKIANSSD
ncbi:hypothetical protein ACO3VM_02695 [Methanocaldococcus sp. 10A]